jgi:uncharacterized membrane protein YtjA (UPF0391 family)
MFSYTLKSVLCALFVSFGFGAIAQFSAELSETLFGYDVIFYQVAIVLSCVVAFTTTLILTKNILLEWDYRRSL